MPALITDEMISAFAVEAAPDEIGPALIERYEGLIDRVALYLPFVPGRARRVLAGRGGVGCVAYGFRTILMAPSCFFWKIS